MESREQAEDLAAYVPRRCGLVSPDGGVEKGRIPLELVEHERMGGAVGEVLQKLRDHFMGMRQASLVELDELGVATDVEDDQGHFSDVHAALRHRGSALGSLFRTAGEKVTGRRGSCWRGLRVGRALRAMVETGP